MTNLKQCRKDQGLTQAELGQRVGITAAYVSMLEKGYRPNEGRDAVLDKLADVLSTPVTELFPH